MVDVRNSKTIKTDANKEWYHIQRLERAVKALQKKKFDAFWVETAEEATQRALEIIPAGAMVGIGGSMTIREIGLFDALTERGNPLQQHWLPGITPEEELAIRKAQLSCEYFLASSNAVTMEGELVNTDGAGNRVASMFFGPKHSIVIAGRNKLVENVQEGIWRIKNVAAPMNSKRYNSRTPCGITGHCDECNGTPRMCNVTTIIEHKPNRIELTVILVNEDLGY